MKINLERLKKNLIELGWFGFDGNPDKEIPTGDNGITRLPYSTDYLKAEDYVRELMEKAGLKVWKDPTGNLFGKLPGKSEKGEMIVIGSHIDTVINGGLFDGSLGVMAAVESLRVLKENNYQNNHDLIAAVFTGEEGVKYPGYLGSRAFIGDKFSDKEIKDLKDTGVGKKELKESAVNTEKIKNYLELHIEQGQVLKEKAKNIGIVEGVVGISRYKALVTGKPNHAGTTPMDMRDDALLKASKVILEINRIVKELNGVDGRMVGTVGQLDVKPGAINVIPGEVEFSIELRNMRKENTDKAIKAIKNLEIAGLEIEEKFHEGGVYLDKKVQKEIAAAAEALNYDYLKMLSGAGHDASPMARVTSAGMVFVPSKNGISHSPEEWTDWQDVEKGANLILETVKKLDNKN